VLSVLAVVFWIRSYSQTTPSWNRCLETTWSETAADRGWFFLLRVHGPKFIDQRAEYDARLRMFADGSADQAQVARTQPRLSIEFHAYSSTFTMTQFKATLLDYFRDDPGIGRIPGVCGFGSGDCIPILEKSPSDLKELQSANVAMYQFLAVRAWVPVVLFALLPALAAGRMFRRWRRRARYARNLCQRCGYDLRATPECCPECGLASSKKVA